MSVKLTELPYQRDSSVVFSAIAHEPWSIFLDSGYPYIDSGRYDIIAGRPYTTLITSDQTTTITDQDGQQTRSEADPFELLKNLLGEKRDNFSSLPVCGGALGYFAYDLGRRIEHLPQIAINDLPVPDMAIGLYDWVVVVDHHQRRSWLVSYGRDPRTFAQWPDLLQLLQTGVNRHPVNFSPRSKVVSNLDRDAYARAFEKIKHYIREGDCYQVNLAQRFMIEV